MKRYKTRLVDPEKLSYLMADAEIFWELSWNEEGAVDEYEEAYSDEPAREAAYLALCGEVDFK